MTAPPQLWDPRRKPRLTVDGSGYRVSYIHLAGGFPFRLTRRDARVGFHQCIFSARGWTQCVYYLEVAGDNSTEAWSDAKAIERAKDLVLYALPDALQSSRRAVSLDDYIDTWKRKRVLLLGSYSEAGIGRLRTLQEGLQQLGYEATLVSDIPDSPYNNPRQKVRVLGELSRFVVVDDFEPSGHIAEILIAHQNDWITVVLRPSDRPSSYMIAGFGNTSKIVLEEQFEPSAPLPALRSAVAWAERTFADLDRQTRATFPWMSRQR